MSPPVKLLEGGTGKVGCTLSHLETSWSPRQCIQLICLEGSHELYVDAREAGKCDSVPIKNSAVSREERETLVGSRNALSQRLSFPLSLRVYSC